MSMSVSPHHAREDQEVFARLQPLGDLARVPFIKNYMKSRLDFLAIKVPVLREMARVYPGKVRAFIETYKAQSVKFDLSAQGILAL
jgi:hypothetical protein